jgi:S-adenosylmethionine:tRNA-ribosyltransferase-isomerase (queuine synthetase)
MKLSHFQFNLPKELLAEHPAENRDESRLMVINRKTKSIEHRMFKDIIEYFDDGDVLILNNTKVFPARLYGNKEKTGARIEVFCFVSSTPSNAFGTFWSIRQERSVSGTSFISATTIRWWLR